MTRHQRPTLTTPERAFLMAARSTLATIEREHPASGIGRDAGVAFRAIGRLTGAELCGSRVPIGKPSTLCALEPRHDGWCRDLDGHAWPGRRSPAGAYLVGPVDLRARNAAIAAAQPLTEAEARLMHGDR